MKDRILETKQYLDSCKEERPMRTEAEAKEAGRQADHIEKHGHQALYSRHTCRNCGLDWTCRLNQCKLSQEGVLCRSCEVEALISEVLNVQDAVMALLKFDPKTDTVWGASLKLSTKARFEALCEDALRIAKMEKP